MSTGGIIVVVISCFIVVFSFFLGKYYDNMKIFYFGVMTALIILLFFQLIGVEIFEPYTNNNEEK